MEQAGIKSARLLEIYSRLNEGAVLKKTDLAQDFHVTQRSIQRDIEDLRCFFAERHLEQDVIYDAKLRGYRLVQSAPKGLTNSEILAVCKILLESRSMRRDEMLPILDKLIDCSVPESSQKAVRSLIANEKLHYIAPHHDKEILNGLWELGQAIKNQQIIEIEYERMKEPRLVHRRVQPVGIMFSEYYFYLTAFLEDKTDFEKPDDLFPTIYRIDRKSLFIVVFYEFFILLLYCADTLGHGTGRFIPKLCGDLTLRFAVLQKIEDGGVRIIQHGAKRIPQEIIVGIGVAARRNALIQSFQRQHLADLRFCVCPFVVKVDGVNITFVAEVLMGLKLVRDLVDLRELLPQHDRFQKSLIDHLCHAFHNALLICVGQLVRRFIFACAVNKNLLIHQPAEHIEELIDSVQCPLRIAEDIHSFVGNVGRISLQ